MLRVSVMDDCIRTYHVSICISDEEISLDGFLKMTEDTLKTVVPKAGPRAKLLALQVLF